MIAISKNPESDLQKLTTPFPSSPTSKNILQTPTFRKIVEMHFPSACDEE